MKLLKPLAAGLALASSALVALPASAATETIDVMVLYTDEMLAETPDADARIALMMNWMNNAFSGSNVDAKVNLVHSQKINFASDSKTDRAALDALTGNQEVATLRQQHGADMVALITETGPYCGIAWVPGSRSQGKLFGKNLAFSVTGSQCVSAFAHELGHNLGLGHSAAQGSTGSLFDWARGHGINNTFVTTMAYGSAYNTRTTAQRFSNPAISDCTGLPCGIDRTQANGADAARNLNQVANEVASYFESTDGGGDDGGGDNGGGDADTEAPSTPANLKTTAVEENSVTLSWVAATDNVGVDHYEVFRNNTRVGTSTRTSYADGGLTAGTTYQYHVIAKDKAGNSSTASNQLSVTTVQAPPPADTQAPTAPSELNVTETTTSSISLSWKAATDNVGVTGYKVLRDGVEIASNAATSYTDSNNLAEGSTYYYEIKATDAANNISAASNRVSAMLQEVTNTKPGAGSDPENILKNGHFDSLESWNGSRSVLQASNLSTGGNQGLLATQRTSRFSGPYQFVDGNLLEQGAEYVFQADIQLGKAQGSAPVAGILAFPTANGWQVEQLVSSSINSGDWSRIEASFKLAHQATGRGYVYFYGPDASYDMLLDEVLLKKVKSEIPETPESTNLINNPGFEASVDGWETLYGGSLVRDTDAFKGNGAAKLSNRQAFSSGLGQSLPAILEPGKTYNFAATMKHTGSNDAQNLNLYLYYQTEGQNYGQWIDLSSKSAVNPDTWTQLTGSITLPDSPITEAYVFAFGPNGSVDLHVDEVSATQAD